MDPKVGLSTPYVKIKPNKLTFIDIKFPDQMYDNLGNQAVTMGMYILVASPFSNHFISEQLL